MNALSKLKFFLERFLVQRHEILLMVFAFIFPISIRISNGILIILTLDFFITNRSSVRAFLAKDYRTILILIAPFLFILISLSYSSLGVKVIEKYLPLLVIPLLLGAMNLEKSKQKTLDAFLLSILVMSVICSLNSAYNFFFLPDSEKVLVGDLYNNTPSKWNALTNTNLMLPFNINPIYMSLYISFAFYILLFRKFKLLAPKIFVLGFLILFQLLIGSRIGLFAFFISLIVTVFLLRSRKIRVYFLLGIACIAILSVSMIFLNVVLKKRFVNDLSALSVPEQVEGWNALNIRVAIWDCSLITFMQSPVWGYGVGDQYLVRNECYTEKYTFAGPFGTNLNSHNQYFEFMLIGGILLLVLFFTQLTHSLKAAILSQSTLHLIFLVLFAVTCLGESLLETHKGIVFFSLFNSFFIFTRSTDSNV